MKIEELEKTIEAAGGGQAALDYSESLLKKINRIEALGTYRALLTQLLASREAGDFRGRVLEVNLVDAFESRGVNLQYGAKQGGKGDIDFCWQTNGRKVFIEAKLLGQDLATKQEAEKQLAGSGASSILRTDDTRDVARLQLDLFHKSSPTKFDQRPSADWINLVAIDVSELQLGTVDFCDCLLAAAGNPAVAMHCHEFALRPSVVGVFESLGPSAATKEQMAWIQSVHKVPSGVAHPRDYIHGALFLFRHPQERAALSYSLSGAVVWNHQLVSRDEIGPIGRALHELIPLPRSAQ